MNEKQSTPEWAPDNCPPAVVQLIDNEQSLEDLGLRGLASADSAEFHQAMRKLKAQLGGAFEAGKQSYSTRSMLGLGAGYLVVGFVAGALCGALLIFVVLI